METDKTDEIIEKFSQLLAKSEERIDRTNEMINTCISIINKLTDEYTTHLNKLQEARDDVTKQNTKLIALIQRYEDDMEKSNKRYDALLEKSFTIVSSNKSENNINVK